jgi:hypothetical protein
MKRDSNNKEHNKVKRLSVLLITTALLFITGAAVAQSATTPSAAVDHSTLDAYALFAVAIFAVVGGLLIRRRSGNNI